MFYSFFAECIVFLLHSCYTRMHIGIVLHMRKEHKKLPKLIVIVGPTASGKTEWGMKLANIYGGEIIGADSRQIFKKMDIGTAKPNGEWKRNGLRRSYMVENIPHYLIDFLDPGKRFSVAQFRDRAVKYAKLIQKNNHIPMLVGGTGLYISAFVNNFHIPRVEPNRKLRQSLEGKELNELLALLKKMDPVAAKNIDAKNKRRLIRALEVCILTGEPFSEQQEQGEQLFDILQIGIAVEREVLYARIEERVDAMIKQGLVKEVQLLMKQKYSWELPSMSGVGYRQFRGYFEGSQDIDTSIALLKRDTRRFARRQLTWFRRDARINWCERYEEAEKLVEKFLQE